MSNKRIFTRYNGYHPCGYGLSCSCNPAPKERKRMHKLAVKRERREQAKMNRGEDDAS